MKTVVNEYDEMIIVPTERQYICRTEDRIRYENEIRGLDPDSEEFANVVPIYRCQCVYMAKGKSLEDHMAIFEEID